MQIFEHILWSFAIFYSMNNLWLLILIGILPDLLAFGPIFIVALYKREYFKKITKVPRSTRFLDYFFHSLVIFALAFIIIYLFYKNFLVFLLPWLIHLVMDIFSHDDKKDFYLSPLKIRDSFPTRFLWPLSDFYINGFNFKDKRFIFLNYLLVFIVLILRIFGLF